ncbi:MAG: hypothetical protein NW203_14205 [Hyphomonadaceae bacterium]|nr:hypothetical protein [Hyphomonadaceae bacterium]
MPERCALSAPTYPNVMRIAALRAANAHTADWPPPGRSATLPDGARLVWCAPRVWLRIEGNAALDAAEGFIGSDITGSLACIRCSGRAWRDMVQSACPLDLDKDFPADASASSVFGHFTILIDVVAADAADLYVSRSYAGDFAHALDAARHRA